MTSDNLAATLYEGGQTNIILDNVKKKSLRVRVT